MISSADEASPLLNKWKAGNLELSIVFSGSSHGLSGVGFLDTFEDGKAFFRCGPCTVFADLAGSSSRVLSSEESSKTPWWASDFPGGLEIRLVTGQILLISEAKAHKQKVDDIKRLRKQ